MRFSWILKTNPATFLQFFFFRNHIWICTNSGKKEEKSNITRISNTARGIEYCTKFDIIFLQNGWMLSNANLMQVSLAIELYCINISCNSDKSFKKYWQDFDRGQKRPPWSTVISQAKRRKRLQNIWFFAFFCPRLVEASYTLFKMAAKLRYNPPLPVQVQ